MIPIAVFAYNRPHHLQMALEALERSQDELTERLPLRIFCDAPRSMSHKGETDATQEVARSWVKDKGGEVVVRERNYGFRNITEGISTLCSTFGSVIVVEDDIVVAPDFLPFMLQGLKKYADEPKVFMISGFMYFNAQPESPKTFFLPTSFIWGWATWERAWRHFTWQPSGLESLLKNRKEQKKFDIYNSIGFSNLLKKTLQKKRESWAILWMYQLYNRGGLSLYPHRTLVWNGGVGGGTNGANAFSADSKLLEREHYIHGNLEIKDFLRPRLLIKEHDKDLFPKEIVIRKKALRQLACTFFAQRIHTEKKWQKKIKLALRYFLAKTGITR